MRDDARLMRRIVEALEDDEDLERRLDPYQCDFVEDQAERLETLERERWRFEWSTKQRAFAESIAEALGLED